MFFVDVNDFAVLSGLSSPIFTGLEGRHEIDLLRFCRRIDCALFSCFRVFVLL